MSSKENGAVLIVLALCLSVIMLFIALGVDTAILGSSHQRQSRSAELGALAAVEAFLATTGDNNTKLTAAKNRAEQVVGFTLNNFLAQEQTSQAQTGQIGDVSAAGERGVLVPGQYFFTEPAETCALFDQSLNNPSTGVDACPCPGGLWKGECFRAHTGASEWDGGTDDRPISAFRMDLYTSTDSPVNTVFSQAGGGQSRFNLFSTAISTVTPRHVVFLIDLSGSMSATSHKYPVDNFDTPPYSSVAFSVTSCSTGNVAGSSDFDEDGTIDQTCTYPGENIPQFFPRAVWEGYPTYPQWLNGMKECRDTNPAVKESIFTHYRDDYECFEVDSDGDSSTTTDIEYFLVENGYYIDGSSRERYDTNDIQYRGPEPLATVLSGVNETLRALSILSVPGDQVTFIAHDHNVASSGPRMFGPVSPGDVLFNDLLRITDHDGLDAATNDDVEGLSKTIIEERIAGQLFPRPQANTDVSEALLRAYVVLTQSPGVEIADNQVVVFGDGLGNCPHSEGSTEGSANPVTFPDVSTEEFLASPSAGEIDFVMPNKACNDEADPAIPSEGEFASAYGCGSGDIYDDSDPDCVAALEAYNNYIEGFTYFKSMSEIKAMVTGEGRPLLDPSSGTSFEPFARNGFKFHTFLFGKHIQPHTVVRKGSSGCMTEGEAREEDLAFADPGSTTDSTISQSPYNADENKPFVKPSFDFQSSLVAPTNGRFFAIREACTPGALNTLPVESGVPMVTAANCANGVGALRLNSFCNTRTEGVGQVIRHTIPGVLQNGRLVCDPYCRDKNEQVNLGISSLFQDNPILAIEPPPRLP